VRLGLVAEVIYALTVGVAAAQPTTERVTFPAADGRTTLVASLMRPAGVLVPSEAGRWGVIAGFNQLEAQVMKPGMVAEVACVSKPMTVIPMVVTNVQGLIAAGQIRASDQLIDAQQVSQPGTLTVYLEPMFDNGFEGIPPGSACIANAYTSNYDRLDSPEVGTFESTAVQVMPLRLSARE